MITNQSPAAWIRYIDHCNRAKIARILYALAAIESGNNPAAIGKAGEVSEYQLTPDVIKDVIKRHGACTHKEVAQYHIAHLVQQYVQHHRTVPNMPDIYVMWNAGFSYYKKRNFDITFVSNTIRERALRFANLAKDGINN